MIQRFRHHQLGMLPDPNGSYVPWADVEVVNLILRAAWRRYTTEFSDVEPETIEMIKEALTLLNKPE